MAEDALESLKEQNQRIWEILTDKERINDLLKELKGLKEVKKDADKG